MGQHEVIVYGAFKAMGDFLSAAPVIKSELDSGSHVYVLIFPGLEGFIQLIDFGSAADNLRLIRLPVSGLASIRNFLRQMRGISPDLVWVSPHAPAPASSWKIPMLLRLTKTLYWRKTTLAGSESERMSMVFDVRSTTSRTLPFAEREWRSYSVLNRTPAWSDRPMLQFRASIQDERHKPAIYDLLIHPGAGAENRKWPFSKYRTLVEHLPRKYRVGVIGLAEDVEQMDATLPADRGIEFVSGTLERSLQMIARSRVLLTMDSGNMFFADMLNVPAIAIFGASDPANVIGFERSVLPVYQKTVACQPCGRKTCILSEPKCITSISATGVADELIKMVEQSKREAVEDALSR
jgi:heptosyltransferase-2